MVHGVDLHRVAFFFMSFLPYNFLCASCILLFYVACVSFAFLSLFFPL